jgi:hypothetical protein
MSAAVNPANSRNNVSVKRSRPGHVPFPPLAPSPAGEWIPGARMVTDKSLENHDFGTLDLTRVSLTSDTPHVKADLRGADFTRAIISNTSFGAVDLTGAKFPTTSTTAADFPLDNFYPNDTVCPDGKAPTVAIPGIAACRVGPKPSAAP